MTILGNATATESAPRPPESRAPDPSTGQPAADPRPAGPTPPQPARHVLTSTEFDIIWERLGLGPTPVVLRLESPGRTWSERNRIVADGWRALRERGLAGPDGADPELARLLRLLAGPAVALELRGWWGRSVRAVAAGTPDAGALAVRQDGTLTVQACGSLPGALLGVLPPTNPGPGQATTLRSGTLAAALRATGGPAASGPAPIDSGAEARLRVALTARAVPAADAGLLAHMLGGTERRAQLVALAGDRWGGTSRVGGVLTVLDGAAGRSLLTRSRGEDGVEWTTVAPTDDRRLRHRLGELLAEAQPGEVMPGSALPA